MIHFHDCRFRRSKFLELSSAAVSDPIPDLDLLSRYTDPDPAPDPNPDISIIKQK